MEFENEILRYEGDTKDGVPEGQGKQYDKTGTLVYEGDFVSGLREGFGKLYYGSKAHRDWYGECYRFWYTGIFRRSEERRVGKEC